MRDQFIEGLFDSRIQLSLYEDERDRDFGETSQRAQELEITTRLMNQKESGNLINCVIRMTNMRIPI